MSVRWTEEQRKVIQLRDRNILVSAAAGSGKTAVLVERIITMLTDIEHPVDVDRLLIVTFTDAAAAEMKERIRDAIERKLVEIPDNEHLKQQATLIHNARITTIHSFCLSVIREHFHMIDIDPGFRIGEEGELKLLKHDVLRDVLEMTYAKGEVPFLDFVEGYAGGKDDRKLEELVLNLYEFSRSYPAPEEWLMNCVEAYRISDEETLDVSPHFHMAMRQAKRYVADAEKLAARGIELSLEEDGPYMYADTLESDRLVINRFEQAETYRQFFGAAQQVSWVRLASNRDKTVSAEKAEQVKAIREEIKDMIKDISAQYFAQSPEAILEDLALALPAMEVLAAVTREFATAFEEKKRALNTIDFDDMEQYALRILTEREGGEIHSSKVAREYQEQFLEVMIDEYQDSNLIQEAILTSVSRTAAGGFNLFMVGDVKQSIYRFRLSRPELFMEKFDTYEYRTEDTTNQRIDLHKNFRSRGEVLDSINFFFEQLMTKPLGGIVYDEQAALYKGAAYKENSGNETEVLFVECGDSPDSEEAEKEGIKISARELEARAIAQRIKELMKEQLVQDKASGELRPVRYSDIVILTRSIKGWSDVFVPILSEEGIPVYSGTKEGYFETWEIGTLLDYLKVLNNMHQDIPLAAVLRSPIVGLTDEELALVKEGYKKQPFYRAVMCYAKEGENQVIGRKLALFLQELERFRMMVPYTAIHELLWKILKDTGYGDYVSAMPGGSQRRANVEMLIEKAMSFESTSYKGLFNFIRYIQQLRKYNVDYGEANMEDEQSDTVRIMSIHKSKGLEFPVVIAAGMGKRFNQQDARGAALVHASLGVGLDAIDLERRTKAPTFLKRVIQREEILESLGEELRVLYVAFTRAKEKLIITGTLRNVADKMEMANMQGIRESRELSFGRLARVSTYWSWILPALTERSAAQREKASVRTDIIYIEEIAQKEQMEDISDLFTKSALESWDTGRIYDEKMRAMLKEQFEYRYPYESMEGKKLKFTVSELKKREYMEEEAGQFLYEEPEVVPLLPKFISQERGVFGATRGSAYHRVMELLDLRNIYDEDALGKAIAEMVKNGQMEQEMADAVCAADVLRFLDSESGQRMRAAAQNAKLQKEQPFVLGLPMQAVYKDVQGEETILVQGIIDVYFEEEDGLVVLDYKTDKVKSAKQLADKYHAQLAYYAKALEQLTDKVVKEKIIYSFTLGEAISL